ncbi:MAG: hypothetical protein HY268_11370 [Deltaproteobacteria bacterium]|nr:hypothetical protein [Deltaproteobacteria bacterium]
MYPVLQFTCAFTSAFHTSENNYSNLYTCAPYILGTTLRGAVLRALIDTDCSGQQLQNQPTFHNHCDPTCQVKPLFEPPTRFSFGTFLPESAGALRTRLGIDRERYSAAEGALLSTEVRYGQFTFSVMFPYEGLQDAIYRAVEWAGSRPDSGGIGRFRSIGWGRFTLASKPAPLTPPRLKAGHTQYRFCFCTPYVLDDQFINEQQREHTLQDQLRRALPAELHDTVQVSAVELRLRSLSYIRRWSDEPGHQRKENRQVAGPDTELLVTFAQPVAEEHLQVWQWGIGEWFDAGFGSCVIEPYPGR